MYMYIRVYNFVEPGFRNNGVLYSGPWGKYIRFVACLRAFRPYDDLESSMVGDE